MKKHLTVFYILLSLLGIIAAIGIFILGFTALKKAQSTQEHVEQTLEQAEAQKESLQAQEKQMKKVQKTCLLYTSLPPSPQSTHPSVPGRH